MAKTKQPNVKLHPVADAALERLQSALQREGQAKPTRIQIVSALLCWTTPPQAAGMLARFLRDTHGTDAGSEGQPEDNE